MQERCIDCRWHTPGKGINCMYILHFKYPVGTFPIEVTPETRPPKGINCFEKDSPEFHQMRALGFSENGNITQIGIIDTSYIKWDD